jgi:hypothetical protein
MISPAGTIRREMPLPNGIKVAVAVALLGAASFVGLRVWRGPVGATTEYGGAIEARVLPDFPSSDAGRWVNGAPTTLASLRGEVVFIEAWAPA